MLWGRWLELSVGPEMALGSSENKDAGKRDRFIHIGIPAIRKQLHCGMPYVLTPWLAPLGGFDHDAATNVAFTALWGRLAQNRESEARAGSERRQLLHLASP